MTNKNVPTVFTTSGFVLPLTAYHVPFKDVSGIADTILTKIFASSGDQLLREFFKSSNIYVSDTAKKLYDRYTAEPSVDNFLAIVDMVTDTLRITTPEQFFQWQMGCKHISSMSVMFCKDVVSGKFVQTYKTYSVLGYNSRFAINNGLTAQVAALNWSQIQKTLKQNNLSNNWAALLQPLMDNRAAFMTFFKHIFVDFY